MAKWMFMKITKKDDFAFTDQPPTHHPSSDCRLEYTIQAGLLLYKRKEGKPRGSRSCFNSAKFFFQTICILALKNKVMIQRIQSVWLLLASVCSFLTFRLSFYFGQKTG